MRPHHRSLIVIAGVVATVAAGGGLTAWAGWTAGGSSAATTARSGRVPVMEPPRAAVAGKSVKIEWDAVRLAAGVPVDQYVVIRIQGSAHDEVCRTNRRLCQDAGATAGGTVTYVVHATKGAHWVGKDSAPSDAVVMPAPKTPSARTNEVSAATGPVPDADTKSASTPEASKDEPAEEVRPGPEPEPAGESAPAVLLAPGTSSVAAPGGDGSDAGASSTGPPAGKK